MPVIEDVGKDLALPPKKLDFANQFMFDFNVKFSAKRAGITQATARAWLKDPAVENYITTNQMNVAQKCNITQEECLNELSKIAFFNHKDILQDVEIDKETGNIKVDMQCFKDADLSAAKSVMIKTDSQGKPFIEIMPYNKLDALKELLSWFDKSKIADTVNFIITKEDMVGRTAQDITKDYHDLVQNAPLPKPE